MPAHLHRRVMSPAPTSKPFVSVRHSRALGTSRPALRATRRLRQSRRAAAAGRRVFLSAPPSTVAIESGDLGPPRPRLHSVRSPALSGHMAGSPIRSPCSERVTVTNPSGLDRLPYLAPLVANSLKSKASEVTAVRPTRRSTPVTTTRGCRPLIRRNDGLDQAPSCVLPSTSPWCRRGAPECAHIAVSRASPLLV